MVMDSREGFEERQREKKRKKRGDGEERSMEGAERVLNSLGKGREEQARAMCECLAGF